MCDKKEPKSNSLLKEELLAQTELLKKEVLRQEIKKQERDVRYDRYVARGIIIFLVVAWAVIMFVISSASSRSI